MSMLLNFADIKQVPITEYCARNGIELVGSGGKYKRLKDHDSCVINTEENLFNWNSHGVAGSVIDFAMAVKGFSSIYKAAEDVQEGSPNLVNYIKSNKSVKKKEKQKVEFDPKGIKYVKMKQAYAYLIQTRGLDKNTVDEFLYRRVLAQGGDIDEVTGKVRNDRNVIFKGLDLKGNIVGAELIGTNQQKRFKKVIEGSYDGIYYRPCEKPDYVFFTEASIDMMSFYEIFKKQLKGKKYWIVSMTGLKDIVIQNTIDQMKQLGVNPIYTLALDNDEGGKNFIKKVMTKEEFKDVEFRQHLPKYKKDWNEELQHAKEQKALRKVNPKVKKRNNHNTMQRQMA